MPIYEYRCQSCGKTSELLQKMSDPPMAACPLCGGEVKKLISSPAVQFKGSGWYVTDYGGKKGAPPSGSKSGEGGGGDSGGGESKSGDKSSGDKSSASSSSSSSESSSSSSGSETKAAKSSD
jgi:putative FmdB family regulatory protein